MTTQGIDAVFLESHNCGKSAKFFQALGFELEFETGHASGSTSKRRWALRLHRRGSRRSGAPNAACVESG